MARYEIDFTLNGVRHHTSGNSSYPQLDMIQAGEYNEHIVMDNVMMFVSGYMDVMHLEGRVPPNSVNYMIYKD